MTSMTRPILDAPAIPDTRTRTVTWERLAFAGVVGLAAVLYVLNLTVSGYANTYYAAAAQAGSQSWTAWFFGSLDAANFITIDKPPLATMLMGLSVRLLGLSSWSVLLPQALAGIAAVAILYASVRRTFGTAAAVIAGTVMALTPAAVLMFRFDNPDALMTLLLVGAGAAVLRSLEDGRWRWLVTAAALVGLAFSTKFLQAYLVLPAFALTVAIAAPGSWRRRLGGLLVAAATVAVTSGWWVLAVELTPAALRPYIGGSQTDSALELLLGYDGLGRIFGQGAGAGPSGAGAPTVAAFAGGAGGPGAGFGGESGLLRMFNLQFGGQVSWFIVFAIVGMAAVLWARRRAPRTDAARAAVLLWGGWLVATALVFSLMSGIIHSYYTVVLAPALGALVGAGTVTLWRHREHGWARLAFAGSLVASGLWAWALLDRTPAFWQGLGVAVAAVSLAAALVVVLPPSRGRAWLTLAAAVIGLVVLFAGPAAYAIDTMGTAYSGGDASAGPAGVGASGFGGLPRGGAAGFGGPTTDRALTDYLVANQGGATWLVAVSGANEAAAIQLATGLPVMAMGGFTGSDPTPSLTEFQGYVAAGEVRFVIVGGRGGPGGPGGPGGSAGSTEVSAWVQATCAAVEVAGASSALYDCAGAVAG
jgi:4-amino-4-deoxy-L-arabinose transferase-like glycosyltransferase